MSRKAGKIGIFGGTFDPFHLGHLNSLQTVIKELELDQIFVIPAHQSPGRTMTAGPTPQQRAEMVRSALKEFSNRFVVQDLEVERGGTSYTVDTLRELKILYPGQDFYLIMGLDQFEVLDRWKDYETILGLANLVVTTRPGHMLPESEADFAQGIAKLVRDFDGEKGELSLGKTFQFIQLEDVDASATEARRRLRLNQDISDIVPEGVAEYIKEHGLYRPDAKRIGDFGNFTKECADILWSKGAIGVIGYDLRERDYPMEYALIGSGTSTRHATGIADNLMRVVKEKFGVYPLSIEGHREGRWVVVDYGATIIHVFYDFTRQEYKLEELWKKGKLLDIGEGPIGAR